MEHASGASVQGGLVDTVLCFHQIERIGDHFYAWTGVSRTMVEVEVDGRKCSKPLGTNQI